MKQFDRGLTITLLLSFLLLSFFYGPVMIQINKAFFGVGGDGLLTYYNTLFHAIHDKDLFHYNGMNYPYGDSALFTNSFLLLSGPMQFLQKYFDTTYLVVFVFNFTILASFILGAVFLYKIFRKLNLPYLYSAIAATGLVFLSPQIARITSHFFFTYPFVFPLVFYMLMLFNEQKSFRISVFLGAFTLLISIIQFYYFALIGGVVLGFWFFSVLLDKNYRKLRLISIHVFIQVILPFIFLSLLTHFADTVADRTNNPWGYFNYISSWSSVLLPLHKPMAHYLGKFMYIPDRPWEGLAFIGVNAVVMIGLVLLVSVKKIFTGRIMHIFEITDYRPLNIFLYTGLIALIFSFGYPFKNGFEDYLDYFNMIKQIRSIGRFAWIFFYAVNIITLYLIYQWISACSKGVREMILLFVFFFLFYDVFSVNWGLVDIINNRITELEDKKNDLPVNQWLKQIDPSRYQAIFPLPYFHIGSESIWYGDGAPSVYPSYITSLKTGLPITAVHLSRTSLSQTYKNMAMVLEPYRPLEVLQDYTSKKPLLIVAKEDALNDYERNLISKSSFIARNESFSVYELPFHALETISSGLGAKVLKELDTAKVFRHGDFYSTEQEKHFLYVNFDSLRSSVSYKGKGALRIPADGSRHLVYEGPIPNFISHRHYDISFWIYDVRQDLVARTEFDIEFITEGKVYYTDNNTVFRFFKTIDKGWALFQTEFISADPDLKIRIYLKNKIPHRPDILVDELLVKPRSSNVYSKGEGYIYINNKYYLLDE